MSSGPFELAPELAPGVPADYYRRIMEAEQAHFFYRGMQAIASALLGARMHAGLRVLDAGCGAGGFLRFLLDEGTFESVAGVDLARAPIELARECVPEADLRLAPLHDLPFEDDAFDLVVSNDVLQHVDEADVHSSLVEIRRVLVADGTILFRTNGSRHLRQERSDWRAYDQATLRSAFAEAGFICERMTYVNLVQSLFAAVLGRAPRAPNEGRHGVPIPDSGNLKHAIGLRLLHAEARYLARPGRRLPYGHTIFTLASPAESPASPP